jgi:adiponectin receptor
MAPKFSTPRLIEWSDLPSWQQEGSQLIQSSYRAPVNTISDCYRTWTYLHNESINIHSHLLGALLFLLLPIHIFTTAHPPRWTIATPADITVLTLYSTSVATCFLLSATYHTLLCHHAPPIPARGLQLDLHGVLLLMWSATIPQIHYAFACTPALRLPYWTLETALALVASAATRSPGFTAPAQRRRRAGAFAALALGGLVPVGHAVLREGWEVAWRRLGLKWWLFTAGWNAAGAVVYALGVPERVVPRRFDVWGASHQVLHVAVVGAAVCHLCGMVEAFDFAHGGERGCAVGLG